MKKINYEEIISRMVFFKQKANLSSRETSLRMGYSERFFGKVECGDIELKMRVFLDFLDIVGINIFDFFYLGKEYNPSDKDFFELFSNLSTENKNTIIDLMKKLK